MPPPILPITNQLTIRPTNVMQPTIPTHPAVRKMPDLDDYDIITPRNARLVWKKCTFLVRGYATGVEMVAGVADPRWPRGVYLFLFFFPRLLGPCRGFRTRWAVCLGKWSVLFDRVGELADGSWV
jgi:hypothetical protein